jgi:NAD(P)-dependent dehydrogenase (short-subunit alcohol dehydrogenase family)
MLERNHGLFVCVSSVGAAYMGAYETFKAAQVHLANTLDAELEGTDAIWQEDTTRLAALIGRQR